MRFTTGKKRTPPAVIIVSLIDILIVLLIFLMVTTTFRQQPAVRLVLPESTQAQPTGATAETVLVTVAKEAPHFYLGERAVSLEQL
ncbi:MAG TPA: biopolymer transporter ExbD, partial [Verrucomicrobiota bacterium]|nr:biopolymer transporter ExbD [Verrucomicrobiota bacterium]